LAKHLNKPDFFTLSFCDDRDKSFARAKVERRMARRKYQIAKLKEEMRRLHAVEARMRTRSPSTPSMIDHRA